MASRTQKLTKQDRWNWKSNIFDRKTMEDKSGTRWLDKQINQQLFNKDQMEDSVITGHQGRFT